MGWGKILTGVVVFLVGGPLGAIVGGVAGAGVSKAMDNAEEERAREQRRVAKGHSEIQEQQEERRKKINSEEKNGNVKNCGIKTEKNFLSSYEGTKQ